MESDKQETVVVKLAGSVTHTQTVDQAWETHRVLGEKLGIPDTTAGCDDCTVIGGLERSLREAKDSLAVSQREVASLMESISMWQNSSAQQTAEIDRQQAELTKTESYRDELLASNGQFLAEIAQLKAELAERKAPPEEVPDAEFQAAAEKVENILTGEEHAERKRAKCVAEDCAHRCEISFVARKGGCESTKPILCPHAPTGVGADSEWVDAPDEEAEIFGEEVPDAHAEEPAKETDAIPDQCVGCINHDMCQSQGYHQNRMCPTRKAPETDAMTCADWVVVGCPTVPSENLCTDVPACGKFKSLDEMTDAIPDTAQATYNAIYKLASVLSLSGEFREKFTDRFRKVLRCFEAGR